MSGERQLAECIDGLSVFQPAFEAGAHLSKSDAERDGFVLVPEPAEQLADPLGSGLGASHDPKRLLQRGSSSCHRFKEQTFKLSAAGRAMLIDLTGASLQGGARLRKSADASAAGQVQTLLLQDGWGVAGLEFHIFE